MPNSKPISDLKGTPDSATLAIHGVLVVVNQVGVLLIGESGIGKSECALDLIRRGHCLVADDAVNLTRADDGIRGRSPELSFEYIEIRGLGIVNARELFGESAVCRESLVELCVEFAKPSGIDSERVGVDMQQYSILGGTIPKFIIPVTTGRNLATLVETAVQLFRIRKGGSDPAARLISDHNNLLGIAT